MRITGGVDKYICVSVCLSLCVSYVCLSVFVISNQSSSKNHVTCVKLSVTNFLLHKTDSDVLLLQRYQGLISSGP